MRNFIARYIVIRNKYEVDSVDREPFEKGTRVVGFSSKTLSQCTISFQKESEAIEYLESVKESNKSVYSRIAAKSIVPGLKYEEAMMYDVNELLASGNEIKCVSVG